MGGGLAWAEFLCFGVFAVVKLVHLQYVFSSLDYKRTVKVETEHFIHGIELAATNTAGFPILWRIVGNAPGAKLLGLAGYGDTCLSGAGRYEFCGQGICATQKQMHVTVALDFLKLVIGITVL